MSCETNSELLELYALGVLDPEEREQVESHLREDCVRCTAELRRASAFNAAVLGSLPLQQPSAGLRARVINSIRPKRTRPPLAWVAVAAGLAAATIWLGFENQRRAGERLKCADDHGISGDACERTLVMEESQREVLAFGPSISPHIT